ncbi:murein hydrolase activator EnvC family protein [Leucothrix arctica]|uniref:Peptidase M23 n=1 Tax=Leucothrix arctica TaxID=1481894 RepID=A0A317CJM6_9GAMM|nr:peptidoglycan DD-metalloendopeptidase family protein [Leucothrix arctica]PWQ98758.1 peptidase M23 [Leucothrix arctica]
MSYRFLVLSVIFLTSFCSVSYAETDRQKIKAEITQANSSLKKARDNSNNIKVVIDKNKSEINRLSRKQYDAENKITSITKQLIESNKTKQTLTAEVEVEKEALAKQLLAMYSSGEESHLRLLLKQDDPSDISRTTKYFEYLNKSRIDRIKTVRKKLTRVKKIEGDISKDRERLKSLRVTLGDDRKSLQSELNKNAAALKQAKRVEVSKQKKLNTLKKEEAALQAVFEKLIRAQKAQAAKEAKAAALAKKKAEAKKAPAKVAKAAPKATPKAAPKSTKKSGKRTTLNFTANKPFSSLRGRLSWPVKGTISKKYGSARNQKQKWKGVLIKAPGGQRVHAVARGKIEYAGPLRGYGYVVIIQHDKSYRTLYTYNRAVYRKTGDIVQAGDVIAAVGNAGEDEDTALYFEIRKGSVPKNPAAWCK